MAGLGKLLSIGGAIGGAIVGGPQGAITGHQLGNMAGGMLNSEKAATPQVQSEGNALSRRLAAMEGDKLQSLREGAIAFSDPGVPPEIRKAYAEPVLTAYQMELKKRTGGLA
jgi:hypothetical protein